MCFVVVKIVQSHDAPGDHSAYEMHRFHPTAILIIPCLCSFEGERAPLLSLACIISAARQEFGETCFESRDCHSPDIDACRP